RARVNGEVIELDSPPSLELRKKHTIEVVVDRIKVRPDAMQRIAESLETACTLAEGIVQIAFIDQPKRKELVFSAKFACSQCGYSLTELEPRLFSFNSPSGACPDCDGLGVKQFFDAKRIVHDDTVTLAAGAIRGWDRRSTYYFNLLSCLAEQYKFSLEVPYETLPKRIQNIIMNGTGKDNVDFSYLTTTGKVVRKQHPFEGVIATLERRYHETDSGTIREELAKYLRTSPCRSCGGARLREEARHVFVEGKSLPEISRLSIDNAYAFFEKLALPGYRGEIAAKVQKELCNRLGFLVNVGLNYLTLDRSAETLSGGEAQRIRLASQIGAGLVGVMYILDEPSIGLHQRDNERLLASLVRLRDLGNTVIVVEHDEDAIRSADHVVDIGPGAGVHGGMIVAQGTPKQVMQSAASITGQYLSGK
ncbi:MAG: excinuclease ABC subunit UvrA, partial [Gammaproteobacteria bacterium]